MGRSDKAPAPAPAQDKDDAEGGPTLSFITKRLRNVRKKLSNIERIEQCVKEGKPINSEQEAALQNKSVLKTLEDELEKIHGLLKPVVDEERALALATARSSQADVPPPPAVEVAPPVPSGPSPEEIESTIRERVDTAVDAKLRRFLDLVYYAKLFDGAAVQPYATKEEKDACLSWDQYKDDGQGDVLSEQDLVKIAEFGRLVTTRMSAEEKSHKDAVESRFRRVLSFLDEKNASDAPVPELSGGEGSSSYSYARVRDRLERISKGEYVLQTPQVQLVGGGGAAVQEEAVPTAAAAGAVVVGNGGGKQAQQWGGGAAAEQRWS